MAQLVIESAYLERADLFVHLSLRASDPEFLFEEVSGAGRNNARTGRIARLYQGDQAGAKIAFEERRSSQLAAGFVPGVPGNQSRRP